MFFGRQTSSSKESNDYLTYGFKNSDTMPIIVFFCLPCNSNILLSKSRIHMGENLGFPRHIIWHVMILVRYNIILIRAQPFLFFHQYIWQKQMHWNTFDKKKRIEQHTKAFERCYWPMFALPHHFKQNPVRIPEQVY